MSAEDLFKDIIEADTTIMALLTGGVYSFKALGETGFVANNPLCSDAFETVQAFKRVKPSMVIRVPRDTPSYERVDTVTQTMSYDGTAQFWIYQYRYYDQIKLIHERLKTLLNLKVFNGLGFVRPLNYLEGLIAPEFESTSLQRDDYLFKGTR